MKHKHSTLTLWCFRQTESRHFAPSFDSGSSAVNKTCCSSLVARFVVAFLVGVFAVFVAFAIVGRARRWKANSFQTLRIRNTLFSRRPTEAKDWSPIAGGGFHRCPFVVVVLAAFVLVMCHVFFCPGVYLMFLGILSDVPMQTKMTGVLLLKSAEIFWILLILSIQHFNVFLPKLAGI
ncbi:hypothetical protein DFS34DRAFT_193990 [Phlyctochytrium arcticum]|nr:hypothetical protein DFS34DRAFT_193990 [Phlyctochytrium arcticum]